MTEKVFMTFLLILQNLFPTGVKSLIKFIMIKKKIFIIISKGNSSTITDIWDIQFAHYNDDGKIFKVEDRIDTLHLAEGNVGPRI